MPPAVRVDGIDMLERLAREHPTEYHVQVVKRLSLFVRTSVNLPQLHEEVRAAMAAIGSRSEGDVRLENNESFELNLSGSNLQNVNLARLNLSGANLIKANLSGARLWDVDLSNARLQSANLEDALLIGANLSGTQFSLGEGDYPAEGVTQAQLETAHSYRNNPPKLDGVFGCRIRGAAQPTYNRAWLFGHNDRTSKSVGARPTLTPPRRVLISFSRGAEAIHVRVSNRSRDWLDDADPPLAVVLPITHQPEARSAPAPCSSPTRAGGAT